MAFDFIEQYVEESKAVPSPESYRLWSAITAISGVLERKVHTLGSAGPIFPNLFTLLVGPPTSGKTNAIRPIREFWAKVQNLNLAPDNVTKAALIDALSKSLRTIITGTTDIMTFSSMAVPCSEFGVFFTHHDLEFLSVLNHIYDSPSSYREERRTSDAVDINKPYLVILAGTQPDFLNSFMPEEAWGMGFASRLIMIYADATPPIDLFAKRESHISKLGARLSQIFEMRGEMEWSQTAIDEINAWNRAGCPPTPTHNKLLHYNGRRALHAIKLSMISSVSRGNDMKITVDDFERAKDWLIAAEVRMPDIFKAMGQKSDAQVITDMHFFLYQKWSSVVMNLRKPITKGEIYHYLHSRVPSERISKIIETAHLSGYLSPGKYPDEWVPNLTGTFAKIG